MPDRSSPQGPPDDWNRGSHAAREPLSDAGTADAYGTGTGGAHAGKPADAFGTAAYRTASFGAKGAEGYGAANADPFGDTDLFGEGGPFAPLATDSHGETAAEAGTARGGAEATAAMRPPGPGGAAGTKGFVGALFDFGFTSFVTPKVIRVLYILITIATVVSALVFTIIVFKASITFGILTLVFADPLFILIVLAIYRMILEFFVVTFRVAEDIRALRERGGLG